ncbi:MAG: hypothetical protein ACK5QT_08035 [Oligoflexia bacterium]
MRSGKLDHQKTRNVRVMVNVARIGLRVELVLTNIVAVTVGDFQDCGTPGLTIESPAPPNSEFENPERPSGVLSTRFLEFV